MASTSNLSIDVHCHTIPPTYFAEMQRVAASSGASSRAAAMAKSLAFWPRICGDPQMIGALDERVELLDAAGLDCQIVSSGVGPAMFLDEAARSAAITVSTNDELSEACVRHPGRYLFWAQLPLPHVRESMDELLRASRLPGYVGAMIPTSIGVPLDDPSLDELYAEMARKRALLFIHPGREENAGRFGRHGMESMLNWPSQDTLAIMELLLGGVLDHHPGLTVVTPHLSGTVLFLLGRIDHHYLNLPADQRHTQEMPSWYVKQMYHDSVTFLPPALDMARAIVGADHIVLGSDFPWQSRSNLGECREVVDGLGWGDDELALVRGGNVVRLLEERGLWQSAPNDGAKGA